MIWCVEDDADIRDIELYVLGAAGFETRGFADGQSAWEALAQQRPALIVLDVMLPGLDGIGLLTRLRSTPGLEELPVILATARGQEYDRIRGLDLGADDYIVKPFSMLELVSRVKAVLRRRQPQQASGRLTAGGLVLSPEEHTVWADGERIGLTYKEFELLSLFLSHPGVVFSREQLFSQVWKQDGLGDSRTLDAHIRTLRQKLGGYGRRIETVRSVGYRWEAEYDR